MSIMIVGMSKPENCTVCPLTSLNGSTPYCDILCEDVRTGLECPIVDISNRRPCSVCEYNRNGKGCERWTCVFDR